MKLQKKNLKNKNKNVLHFIFISNIKMSEPVKECVLCEESKTNSLFNFERLNSSICKIGFLEQEINNLKGQVINREIIVQDLLKRNQELREKNSDLNGMLSASYTEIRGLKDYVEQHEIKFHSNK
jgi:hypothetical protein